MLKIDKLQDTYTWKITVKIPNNGSFDKWPVTVKYNRLPHDERIVLMDKVTDIVSDESMDDAQRLKALNTYQDELFDKVFAGWEKGQITDENGELEDDAAGRAQLLKISEFRSALFDGWQKSSGGDKVAEGNS